MSKLTTEQLRKLAAVEIMAEVNDNFDILGVLNKLIYVPNAPGIAWTDGKGIYMSSKLFDYSVADIYFIINHEFDHIYYRHHNRFVGRRSFKHYLVNIATDLIINEILEQSDGLTIPDGAITRTGISQELETRIRGRNSEAVYKEIVEALKKKPKKEDKMKQQGQGQGDGEEQESDESQDGEGQESSKQQKGSGARSSSNVDADTEDSSEIEKLLDEVLGSGKGRSYMKEIDDQEESLKQSKSQNGEISEEDQEKIEAIKERIMTKMGAASKREKEEIDRGYKPPVVDWKKLLRQFLGRHLKRAEVRNYSRPTRRYDDVLGSRVILPSNKGYIKTPKINVYLDISGSMSHIIQNVRDILKEARKYFKQYSGKYYEFDTEIVEFKRDDFYGSTNIGGGTDIKRVLTHYIQDDKADLGILITDAEDQFSSLLETIKKPTLILTNNEKLETNNPKVTLVKTQFD